jgi:hypothetical protein
VSSFVLDRPPLLIEGAKEATVALRGLGWLGTLPGADAPVQLTFGPPGLKTREIKICRAVNLSPGGRWLGEGRIADLGKVDDGADLVAEQVFLELNEHAGNLGWDAVTWVGHPSPGRQTANGSKAVYPVQRHDGYVN